MIIIIIFLVGEILGGLKYMITENTIADGQNISPILLLFFSLSFPLFFSFSFLPSFPQKKRERERIQKNTIIYKDKIKENYKK